MIKKLLNTYKINIDIFYHQLIKDIVFILKFLSFTIIKIYIIYKNHPNKGENSGPNIDPQNCTLYVEGHTII